MRTERIEIELETASLDVACERAAAEAIDKFDGWDDARNESRSVRAVRFVGVRGDRCWRRDNLALTWTYAFEVDVE